MSTEATPEFFKNLVVNALQRLKVIDGTVVDVTETKCSIEIYNELVKVPCFAIVFSVTDMLYNVYILPEADTKSPSSQSKPIASIRNAVGAMEVTMAIHMLYSNPPSF